MTDDAASARDADQNSGAASSTDSLPPPFPPPYEPPTDDRPPFGDGPSFQRDQLIRPLRPRYVAGVCGALARATNTDPVLWRVLLTVLGLFGGAGVLIYLIGWLAIPAETDTASPIESLLGRGRSSMKPLSIVLLGGAAVLTFAFVVNDGFRAALLAVAVLVGAGLLIKKSQNGSSKPAPPPWTPPASEAPTATFPVAEPGAEQAAAPTPPAAPEPPTQPLNVPPGAPDPSNVAPTAPQAPRPPQFAPPVSGYRPPFAPHGPYAGPSGQAAPPPPLPPQRAPQSRQPRQPKEKSKLGSMTFFALVLVMGFLTVLSLAGISVPVSAFFAAALATIALGLIVGAWIGRARGLIALALIATLGLGVSTGLERWGGQIGSNVYRPASLSAVADRYDFSVGNATLDLRRVDFANAEQNTTIEMKFGSVQVLLPPNVDVTSDVTMSEGRAVVFGTEYDALQVTAQPFTDQGADGAGGGALRLNIVMNTGNVEVAR